MLTPKEEAERLAREASMLAHGEFDDEWFDLYKAQVARSPILQGYRNSAESIRKEISYAIEKEIPLAELIAVARAVKYSPMPQDANVAVALYNLQQTGKIEL